MEHGFQKITTAVAALGAFVLLALPIVGALSHPNLPGIFHSHAHVTPLLPVPESFAWSLVALGVTLFASLRAQAIQAACPLSPSRLAQSSQWELLATGSRRDVAFGQE